MAVATLHSDGNGRAANKQPVASQRSASAINGWPAAGLQHQRRVPLLHTSDVPMPAAVARDSMDCTSSKATASARDCAASSSKPTVEYASARLLSTYGKPGSGVYVAHRRNSRATKIPRGMYGFHELCASLAENRACPHRSRERRVQLERFLVQGDR
jgi:hypothetical protein